jgi:hypothetical protein
MPRILHKAKQVLWSDVYIPEYSISDEDTAVRYCGDDLATIWLPDRARKIRISNASDKKLKVRSSSTFITTYANRTDVFYSFYVVPNTTVCLTSFHWCYKHWMLL